MLINRETGVSGLNISEAATNSSRQTCCRPPFVRDIFSPSKPIENGLHLLEICIDNILTKGWICRWNRWFAIQRVARSLSLSNSTRMTWVFAAVVAALMTSLVLHIGFCFSIRPFGRRQKITVSDEFWKG